jgi:hypothetical protein
LVATFFLAKRVTDDARNRAGLAVGAAALAAAVLVFIFPAAAPWNAAPPSSDGNAYAERVRNQILAADGVGEAQALVRGVWDEEASGLDDSNQYDPSGCPSVGYGLAWNVQHAGRRYTNTVLAFTTPKRLEPIPGQDGWYVRVCLHEGLSFSAVDAAKIQAAMLQQQYPDSGLWEYRSIDD